MHWLLIESGSHVGRRIEVVAELIIGRAGADLSVDDPEVSRRHAAVRPTRDGVEVEDLGSTNGTWVNDRRITGRQGIVPGDSIRIGGAILRLGTEQAAVPPERVAPPPAAPSAPPPPAVPVPAAAPVAAPASPAFGTAASSRRRVAATRSYVATSLVVAVILADAVALIVYFALR